MRALQRRWRGLGRTTDVLAFPMDGGPPVLGDVVISVETVRRRARGGIERALTLRLVHGFLHLAGHDHEKPAERRRMRLEERRLLARVRRRVLS